MKLSHRFAQPQFGAIFKLRLKEGKMPEIEQKMNADDSFTRREQHNDWVFAGGALNELAGVEEMSVDPMASATNFKDTRANIRLDETKNELTIQTGHPVIDRPTDYDITLGNGGVISKLFDEEIVQTCIENYPWESFGEKTYLGLNPWFYISDDLSPELQANPNQIINDHYAIYNAVDKRDIKTAIGIVHHPEFDPNLERCGVNTLAMKIHPDYPQEVLIELINHPQLDFSVKNTMAHDRTLLGWARHHGLIKIEDTLLARGVRE